MRTGDKLVIVVMAVFVAIMLHAHNEAQTACLTATKPKTSVTGSEFVSPFTGAYKRQNGVLYCYDSSGILHAHREERHEQ